MFSSKHFRCYVVYKKGKVYDNPTTRRGEFHWVVSIDAPRARSYVNKIIMPGEILEGERVDRIVATAFKEDVALRQMGAAELPFKLLE